MSDYERFRRYTMVEEPTWRANIDLVVEHLAHNPEVKGAVVECGVWKGGMIAGIAAALGPQWRYVLADSFQGLPNPGPLDGPAAHRWAGDIHSPGYHDNCSAAEADAVAAMSLADAEHVRIVKGWFRDTLSGIGGPIAVLRLDGDWYESTSECLGQLWDRVAPWGLVILDDYYIWDGCSRAVHDFLAAGRKLERIRVRHPEVAYIVKGWRGI